MVPTFRMQERDLDLVILEELHAESGFDRWFAGRIGLVGFTCRRATHSVSARANAKWGETDVLALFSRGEESVAVLIEDKIAAQFQDTQAERYRERGDQLVDDGEAGRALIVLVAPKAYLSGVPEGDPWDARLTVEELRDWFAERSSAHDRWRAMALGECLGVLRRTATAENEDVVRFSRAFAAFLDARYAGRFSHQTATEKSYFSIRTSPQTPKNVTLAWKPGKSVVDLTFTGQWIAAALEFDPLPGIDRRATYGKDGESKAVIFGISVPPVDLTAPFNEQTDVAEAVTAAAMRLLMIVPKVLKARTDMADNAQADLIT
jgi:hypothetical protein